MAVTIINRNVNIEHTGQKGPEGFGTAHIITSYVHLKGGNLQSLPEALQSKCLEKWKISKWAVNHKHRQLLRCFTFVILHKYDTYSDQEKCIY